MGKHATPHNVGTANTRANDNDSKTAKGRIAQRVFRSRAKDSFPHTLRHERIYILPSTRGIAFICVIAIMMLASINYGLNLGYALCFILIGLICSCLLSTYRNLVQIVFVHAAANDTFVDSPLIYKIILSDKSKRTRSSIKISSEQANDTTDLQPNGTAEASLLIKKPQRGIHTLGRLTISSDYPLGLWRAWGYVHTPVQSYVYPKPEQPLVAQNTSSTESDGAGQRRKGEQEYQGLKTYENTDSPARVAWKQAASGRGMYSKQFEAEDEQQEIAIHWDDTPANLAIEQRLSRMTSWIVKAMDDNSAYTFELPGNGLANSQRALSGNEYSKACLRSLASFQTHKSTPL